MLYRCLADAVVLVHFSFVAFVVAGGLIVLRWPRAAWLHVPAIVWGVAVEWSGAICPLTPLEGMLRRWGGEPGYDGGFVEHTVLPLLYPAALTRGVQIVLGALVVAVNTVVYAAVFAARATRT
jgi:hypothetical protein